MVDTYFNIDPEIIIGTDTINRCGTMCAKYGTKTLIVADLALHASKIVERLVNILQESNVESILFDEVQSNARGDLIESIVGLARASRCSNIIGIGGITTQSVGRAVALLSQAELDIFDLLDGKAVKNAPLPYVSIPSTKEDALLFANLCLVTDPRDRSDKLIRLPTGLSKAVIIDDNFRDNFTETTSSILDGFCMALEAYCSKKTNFVSEPLLEKALTMYAKLLRGEEESMGKAGFLASLGTGMGGAGMGSLLAYLMAGRFSVPKSLCVVSILPAVVERLCAARPEKVAHVGTLLGLESEGLAIGEAATGVLTFVRSCMEQQQIDVTLSKLGLKFDLMISLAEEVSNLEFTAYSPWPATLEELIALMKQSL